MLLAQSRFDFVMLQCSNIGAKELSVPDQARLIGLLEYMFRSITQVAGSIREKVGLGWNTPEPGDQMIAEDMTPNARNLLAEYIDTNDKAN